MRRGLAALLVGGSGLYLRALVDDLEFPATDPATRSRLQRDAETLGSEGLHGRLAELDPVAAAKIEPGNVRRTVRALEVTALTGRPFSSFADTWERFPPERVRAAGIQIPRPILTSRIERRVEAMVRGGLLDEVSTLVGRGFGGWLTSTQAIGYAEFARHLAGELSLDEAVAGTVKRTRALARRQLAWFRRDPQDPVVRGGGRRGNRPRSRPDGVPTWLSRWTSGSTTGPGTTSSSSRISPTSAR